MDAGRAPGLVSQKIRMGPFAIIFILAVFAAAEIRAQIDPEKRSLIHLSYNQPLQGRGPLAAYGFYYRNEPNFLQHSNLTLRLAIAPVYLDSELGFTSLFGPNTDFAVSLAGGGYADSYSEVRQGEYLKGESFDGHGAELGFNIYHRFNPDSQIPLNGILRTAVRTRFFEETGDTAPDFEVPDDFQSLYVRGGFRFGGREPSMTAPLAMELSGWYEGHFRTDSGPYGFDDDRSVLSHTHLFWSRALLKYTFDESQQYFDASVTAGLSANPDRLSAYRMGGYLPFISDFPLNIPGYYYQELSATRFALINLYYSFPFVPNKSWSASLMAAGGAVDYLEGLEQSDDWHSGVGTGITYTSPRGAWFVSLFYGHGFGALRDGERGADQVGLVFQYDFRATKRRPLNVNPYGSRGTERIFR